MSAGPAHIPKDRFGVVRDAAGAAGSFAQSRIQPIPERELLRNASRGWSLRGEWARTSSDPVLTGQSLRCYHSFRGWMTGQSAPRRRVYSAVVTAFTSV